MTIYSNDMKSYGMRNGVAQFLGMPRDQVRVVWMEGPQAYGRTAADDAGFEAAYMAKEIGRPVRVQWMRDEETAWDTKGPAFTFKLRGALDAQGNLVAFDYDARAADYNHLGYNEPDTVLIAQLMGVRRTPEPAAAARRRRRTCMPFRTGAWRSQVVSLPLVWETPLRTGNLRDPNGPQTTFASESFIDELAAAAKVDPVEFRLKLLTARHHRRHRVQARALDRGRQGGCGSVRLGYPAVAEADRQRRHSDRPRHRVHYRSQTVVAQIAEVEVNRQTGHVWVKRLVCAHDCGLVINPKALRRTIEGGMLHSLSRALHEEVQFDTEKVTSVDWVTHPTLTHTDTPERIDVVIVNGDPNPNRPDLPHYGAGETVCKPTARGGRECDLRCDRGSTAPGSVPRCARAGGAEGRAYKRLVDDR